MFAAALLYSCAGIELSIYSTCKRISQKLLRNVVKFLDLIYESTGETPMRIIRANCEEIHIQGKFWLYRDFISVGIETFNYSLSQKTP